MKVVHLCLASFYIDNFSYQENLLPKYHNQLGLEVEIIASLETFDKNGKKTFLPLQDQYINEHGLLVTRLDYKKSFINKKLRKYIGTYETLIKAKPDIIFIHGCQFLDIYHVVRYVKENPTVKVYVDNHADFSNSATNWVSKNILHKIIWKMCAKKIEPYTSKFYGVLPARVDFLKNIYRIPSYKVDLLVMGADDEKVSEAKSNESIKEIRRKYNIHQKDFLIVTGGKIDSAKKQTMLLMQAIKEIGRKDIKLIVFGSVIEELQESIKNLSDGKKIQYIGWISSEDSYRYFAAANLVIFPGRHSVFWEQVAGLGIPLVVKYWEGTTHVDVGGNCDFLYHDSVDEIKSKILELVNNKEKYKFMSSKASQKGKEIFSYKQIAQKSLESVFHNL